MNISGKKYSNRAKNHTIGQRLPKLTIFSFFMFFLAVQILNFHVFLDFRPYLNYIYLSPCHRIIFEYEVVVCGWKPVRFSQVSADRTAALCFWHCWFAGRLHDKFRLGFPDYAPPSPCHSVYEIDFNTIEPDFVAQSASGNFLARAKYICSC